MPAVPVFLGPPLPSPLPPLPQLDFRQLLSMTATQRQAVLANRTAADRQVLEAKLKEYDALSPDERETRLRAVQLRLYLRPLMKMAASNRVERLKAIPEPDRESIVRRLAIWDQMPPQLQREVMENESVLSALVHPDFALPRAGGSPPGAPSRPDASVDGAIEHWNSLSEEKRREINEHFQAVFQLDDREKAKFLEPLTETERRQMVYTLQAFRRLTPAQREVCFSGVHKFAELSPAERHSFLHNVTLWQEMTPKDRQLWREIAARFRIQRALPPPMPPPRIPHAAPQPAVTALATNN